MKVACLWFPQQVPMLKLAENCLRLSPQICFRQDQALFIEYGKCKKLYSEESFLARLQVILRRMKLSPQIALGKDIPDSLVLAKYKVHDLDVLPVLSLLDFVDPFNCDPVGRKYVQKMISHFLDLGVSNIGQFRKIPTSELVPRFGPISVLCQQRVKGENILSWPTWKPADVISEKSNFPYFEFYGELEPILFELKKQLDQIFQRLWSRGLKAQTIRIRIFCERNSFNPEAFRNFEFDFLFPQSQTKGALNVIKERLSQQFQKKPIVTPIEALETTVTQTVVGLLGQKNLLHNREEVSEQLASLLSQLSESHGKENIFQAEIVEDRRPEKSWKKSLKIDFDNPIAGPHLEGRIPLRPTHLLRPEKIEVTAGFVHIRKKPFKIVRWAESVERISGGWNESSSTKTNTYDRNYYQVELESGTLVTIFETPKQQFYLHGYFG